MARFLQAQGGEGKTALQLVRADIAVAKVGDG